MDKDSAVQKNKKTVKRRPMVIFAAGDNASAEPDTFGYTDRPARVDMERDTYELSHCCDYYMKPAQFHYHDFWEVYTFLSGTVTYHIEDKVYHLCAGDVLVIPPGKMHCPHITFQSEDYERIVLMVSIPMIHTVDDDSHYLWNSFQRIEQEEQYLFHLSQRDFSTYTSLLHDFVRYEEEEEGRGQALVQRAYLVLLFQHIFNYLSANDPVTADGSAGNIIPAVIAYINEHLSEPLSLERLSEHFSVSKYHLIRKFKSYTNSTVYDYIISKRISLAKRLLREGASATNACMQCGFSDYSNFYKSFQAKTGMTPAQFKKK